MSTTSSTGQWDGPRCSTNPLTTRLLRRCCDKRGSVLRCVCWLTWPFPNHWHLVVWPQHDGELSIYAQWLTITVYQGRFKSFPVQEDDHFFTVCRYVERNPLRANLVARAEAWRWSSLWHRCRNTGVPWLSAWPLAVPEHWLKYVNGAETESELAALRRSVVRGAPSGDAMWQQQTAAALALESALRGPGRPSKSRSIASKT